MHVYYMVNYTHPERTLQLPVYISAFSVIGEDFKKI